MTLPPGSKDVECSTRGHMKVCRLSRHPPVPPAPCVTPPVAILTCQHLLSTSPSSKSPSETDVSGTDLDKQDSCYFSDSENGHSDLSGTLSAASDHRGSHQPSSVLASADAFSLMTQALQEQLSSLEDADREVCNGSCDTSTTWDASVTNAGDEVTSDDDKAYVSLVEFALRLGYSESTLRQVLLKLGSPLPGQDLLLQELVKFGQDLLPLESPQAAGGATGPQASPQPESARSTPRAGSAGSGLRAVIIDGSNVAMTFGKKKVFACQGIRLCVDWFLTRGHRDITVFVPQFRKEESRPHSPITDQEVLEQLEEAGLLVWTPSRRMGSGRRVICYDDRYILKTAVDKDAVIVSNDEFRDLVRESADFKKVVDQRLLMYSFVDNKFMPPDDPLGRWGPSLDNFLQIEPPVSAPVLANSFARPCPYGKKCTYGNKCKFSHPERGNRSHQSVTDRLLQQAEQERYNRAALSHTHSYDGLQRVTSSRCGSDQSLQLNGDGKPPALRSRSFNPSWLQQPMCETPPQYLAPQSMAPRASAACYHPRLQLLRDENRSSDAVNQQHSAVVKQLSNPEQLQRQSMTSSLQSGWPMGVERGGDWPGRGALSASVSPSESTYLSPSPTMPSIVLGGTGATYGNMGTLPPNMAYPVQSPSHLSVHAPVGRYPSAPNSSSAIARERRSSLSDPQLSVGLENVSPSGHFYLPPTSIWGEAENSFQPVLASNSFSQGPPPPNNYSQIPYQY